MDVEWAAAQPCWHGDTLGNDTAMECQTPFAAQQVPAKQRLRHRSSLTPVEDDDSAYLQPAGSVPGLQATASDPSLESWSGTGIKGGSDIDQSARGRARLGQSSSPSSFRARAKSTPNHLHVLSQALCATRNALELLNNNASGSSAALTHASSSGGIKTSVSIEELRDLDTPVMAPSSSFSAGFSFNQRRKTSASIDQLHAASSSPLGSRSSVEFGAAGHRHTKGLGYTSVFSPPSSPLSSHPSTEAQLRPTRRRPERKCSSLSGHGAAAKVADEQQHAIKLSPSVPGQMHDIASSHITEVRRDLQGTPRHGPVGRARRNGYMLPHLEQSTTPEIGEGSGSDFDFWAQQLALAGAASPTHSEGRPGGSAALPSLSEGLSAGSEALLVVWE